MAFPVPHIIYPAGGERIVPIRRNLGFGVGGSDDYDSAVGRSVRWEKRSQSFGNLAAAAAEKSYNSREGHWKLCQNALGQTDIQRGLYVVARNFFLLLLNCSAWP